MKIISCVQGSAEWLAARRGIPTASEMDALVSPLGKVRTGEGPRSYVFRKVCERLLGFTAGGSSWATEQGTLLESEAVPWFNFTYDANVQRVGFITTDDGRAGCSPDGLLGDDAGLEVKCLQHEHALQVLLDGVVPPEYSVQIQTSLYVTGFKRWTFLSYSRQFPALILQVEPDPKLQGAIKTALEIFNEAFDLALGRITAMRDAENAVKQAQYEQSGDRSR